MTFYDPTEFGERRERPVLRNTATPDELFDPNAVPPTEAELEHAKEHVARLGAEISHVRAADAFPRTSVSTEDVYLQGMRERAVRMLMEVGNEEHVKSIQLCLSYSGRELNEINWADMAQKLMQYGDVAGRLASWLELAELMAGPAQTNKAIGGDFGLIGIQLDKTIAEKMPLAIAGVKRDQENAGIPASKISISDAKINSWLLANVKEISDLKRDLTIWGTIARTLHRAYNLVQRLAQTHETLSRQYTR